MNKAITEGLVLAPTPFANGLDVWSRGDGRPGSATYDGYATAGFVPSDQDFGGCLEIFKIESTQRLRFMAETPLQPGCYLQIKARIKVISGNLPSVRIAGFAGDAARGAITDVPLVADSVEITSYGDIFEITAIVGNGARPGVDLVWGGRAIYGHFGLDLTGANGGVVRIDDIEITDVTGAFLRNIMDWVDVKDFGAVGDGLTDNVAAFEAADAAANGRSVLVSSGVYALGNDVSFQNPVRFEGTVVMGAQHHLNLRRNFDLDSYVAAFGDEVEGFKKAFQTLIEVSDHESLDMNGRSVALRAPIEMAAAVPGKSTHTIRRVIRNGQFDAVGGSAWTTGEVSSSAKYSADNPLELTDVTNVASIEIGSLVEGRGAGREVYVKSRNIGGQSLEISQPLFDPRGTQTYTFKRFRYMLDFSGFDKLAQFNIADVDFKCDGVANAVMLSKDGIIWQFRDVFFNKPKDRAITSLGRGCQGMQIDGCQFLSNEQSTPAHQRQSIALNINANDVKMRGNRAVRWGHWAVMSGSGHLVNDNHWFQGDEATTGLRKAGLIITQTNAKIMVNGNHIDNTFIEWTNEHDAKPEHSAELSFGSLSITGNIFTCSDCGPWFRWIVIKPYGSGHFVNGLTVVGNTFKALDGNVARAEEIDDGIAELRLDRTRNVTWTGNTYHGVDNWTMNPAVRSFDENSATRNWDCDFSDVLPFGGPVRVVEAVQPEGPLRRSNNAIEYAVSYTDLSGDGEIDIVWPVAVKGRISVTARMDRPF